MPGGEAGSSGAPGGSSRGPGIRVGLSAALGSTGRAGATSGGIAGGAPIDDWTGIATVWLCARDGSLGTAAGDGSAGAAATGGEAGSAEGGTIAGELAGMPAGSGIAAAAAGFGRSPGTAIAGLLALGGAAAGASASPSSSPASLPDSPAGFVLRAYATVGPREILDTLGVRLALAMPLACHAIEA